MNIKESELGSVKRASFCDVDDFLEISDLVEIQKKSYKWFLD